MSLKLEKRKEEFLNLYKEGLSDREIAEQLNVFRKTVGKYRNSLGLKPNKKKIIEYLHIEKDIKNGLSDIQIAAKYNISSSGVSNYRKCKNIKSNIRDRVSKNDKLIINELVKYDFDNSFIAKVTNKSLSFINILTNKTINAEEYSTKTINTIQDFSKEELAIIIGILMGDGNIDYKQNKNSCFSTEHSPKQKEYVFHIAKKLINLSVRIGVCTTKIDIRTNKRYTKYWLRLSSSSVFTYLYKIFYPKGIKIIPDFLYKYYTEESLAYQYMDDGSKIEGTYKIATNCFSKEDLIKFQYFLLTKFNIETTIHSDHGLYIRKKSTKHFEELVSPYIIDSMKYKLYCHVTS